MKKLIGLGIVVCALAAPALAQAQARVMPVAWRDDGNLVIEVQDPMGGSFTWAEGKGSEDFFAVCTPAPLGAAMWGEGCEVCLQDASAGSPASCGLDKLKKWPKPLKSVKKSPNKKIAVSDKRKCTGAADEKACINTISVGKLGTIAYENSNVILKPAITAYFRKDSNAVLIMVEEESRSDEAIRMDTFQLLDLTPSGTAGGGKAETGGGSAFIKKWQKLTDKLCACKDMECMSALTQEITDLANELGTEAANMSAEDLQKLQEAGMRMQECMTKLSNSP